jgi:hypothetical protein
MIHPTMTSGEVVNFLNLKERWRFLPGDMKKGIRISLLLTVLLALSLWSTDQRYASVTLRSAALVAFGIVYAVVIVNAVYSTMRSRKEMSELGYWNPTAVSVAGIIILIVLLLLFINAHLSKTSGLALSLL